MRTSFSHLLGRMRGNWNRIDGEQSSPIFFYIIYHTRMMFGLNLWFALQYELRFSNVP
jgi:hypothetical protein